MQQGVWRKEGRRLSGNQAPTPVAKVLVVDDDRDFRQIARRDLEERGYLVRTVSTGEEAFRKLDESPADIVLLDYRLPGEDGMAVLERVRAIYPGTDVVMITSYGSIPMAVEAMKHGAAEYITKPFLPDEVARTLSTLVERRNLIKQNKQLLALLNERWGVEALKGRSADIRRIREQIRMLGSSTATVLITGESGTGKELVARALHVVSPRSGGPFVALNAAGLSQNLAESELFGHKKGAFTGADRDKDGLFVAANNGTLFFDEISEMPLDLQPKLLRAIETLEIRPVGSEETRKVNVRMIAATNRDLEEEVATGRFRRDLFYRLNVVRIHIPPLRERRDDVADLAEHFLAQKRGDKSIKGFTPSAMSLLENYAWPGNARELENAVERAVALSLNDIIDAGDLPRQIAGKQDSVAYSRLPSTVDGAASLPLLMLAEMERLTVIRTMAVTGGDKSRAARILGINRATLYRKLREYGVLVEERARSAKAKASRTKRKGRQSGASADASP